MTREVDSFVLALQVIEGMAEDTKNDTTLQAYLDQRRAIVKAQIDAWVATEVTIDTTFFDQV